MIELDGPRFGPHDGGETTALVVMLHGVGADGNDLIGIAPMWAPLLPGVAFVAPNGPEPCDMAPYGYQWFSLQDRRSETMLAGVQSAAPIVNAFIDRELERHGLGPDRLALVGFSQGTMTALYTAPRRPAPVAGVLGYSGALMGAATLAAEATARPPVMLVHGTDDQIVPFQAMAAAEQVLSSAGIPVETFARPGLAHGIDQDGLRLGLGFLKHVLSV
ncbi:dienelactone hydrolase family protein [Thalassobaculum sp.]|uniref:alpha/beta hydrolase n=1 Tax=Thalassobaculum sp. TaxID=2022740 RepID=UPI0032EB96AD